ncbi:MAG: DUF1003 domain-containing protein [Betaproteobacteria bacterium]|jgi:uncharacterized membrane protein|nr:DUF1003 domain-containing protein [Betaproteobacteria bacterium]
MNDHHPIEASSISTEDAKLLSKLRAHRRTHRKKLIPEAPDQVGHFAVTPPTRGQLLADLVARTVGSWRFIIFQSTAIVAWIVGNVMMAQSAWDPYPFILLNLLLSFQAAYTAPAIMMSQNRQSELDRRHAQSDYEINIKAELEIELLHEKINLLREQELAALTQAVKALTDQVKLLSDPDGSKHT